MKQQPGPPSESDRLKSIVDAAERKSAAAADQLARVRLEIAEISRRRAEDDGAHLAALLQLEDDALDREAKAERTARIAVQSERAARARHRAAAAAERRRELEARSAELAERLSPVYQAEAQTIQGLVALSAMLQDKIQAADRRVASRSAPRIPVPPLLAGKSFREEARLPRLTTAGFDGCLVAPGHDIELDPVTLGDDLLALAATLDDETDYDILKGRIGEATATIFAAYDASARKIVDVLRADAEMRREIESALPLLREAPRMGYVTVPSPARLMTAGAIGALCAAVSLPAAAPGGRAHWLNFWNESLLLEGHAPAAGKPAAATREVGADRSEHIQFHDER